MAGTIPELKAVADKLDEEKSTHSKKLSEKIKNSVPRFEGSEEVSYDPPPSSYSCSLVVRNVNAETIALRAKHNFLGLSLDFPFMKAVLVGKN